MTVFILEIHRIANSPQLSRNITALPIHTAIRSCLFIYFFNCDDENVSH